MPAAATVVEQQAAHIPAEWLLQVGSLLGGVAARRGGDLRIAWRLDDCRIGRCGRWGGGNRQRGSSRSQQRGDVLDFHVISLVWV